MTAHRGADGGHRFAYDSEKDGAGILHHVPSIGNSDCLGQRPRRHLAVAAAAVTGEDDDLSMG